MLVEAAADVDGFGATGLLTPEEESEFEPLESLDVTGRFLRCVETAAGAESLSESLAAIIDLLLGCETISTMLQPRHHKRGDTNTKCVQLQLPLTRTQSPQSHRLCFLRSFSA